MRPVVTTVDDETVTYELPVVDADGYELGTLRVVTLIEENWRLGFFKYMGVSAHLAGVPPVHGGEHGDS